MMKKFLENFNKKEHPHGAAFFVPNYHSFSYVRNGKAFVKEGYQRNVIVYRAIKEITTAISSIKFQVKRGDDIIDDDSNPFAELLNNPNPMQGQDEFLENVFTDYLINGEMFIARYPESGEATELWAFNPLEMEVKPGSKGIPSAYIHKRNSSKKIFPVNPVTGESQMFMFKTYNPCDYWRGQSPLLAAALAGDTHNAGLLWNYSLLSNGARPSGIIKMKGSPSGDVINRLTEFFKDRIQGQTNSGELPVLTDETEWQEISSSPRDMDYLNTMKETAKYVASAFGVPLPLIDNDASTFNNLEQAKERLWTDTVLPLMNKFLASFNTWIDSEYTICIDLDRIPALEAVRQKTYDRAQQMVNVGIITPNEAREMIGYDPRGVEGDILYVDSNKLPLGMVTDEPTPETRAIAKKALQSKSLTEDQRTPPKSAQENAERGLRMRREWGRGGTEVGVARARDISNGSILSEETITRMASFNRHRQNYNPDEKDSDGGPTAGTIAWLLWGGSTGIDWALRQSDKIESEDQ